MALALRAWAINRGGKNSVRNLRYGPRTRLVRSIYGDIHEKNSKFKTFDHLLKTFWNDIAELQWYKLFYVATAVYSRSMQA